MILGILATIVNISGSIDVAHLFSLPCSSDCNGSASLSGRRRMKLGLASPSVGDFKTGRSFLPKGSENP